MYHYADRPGLSTERSRQAIAQDYNTTIYGLPGNDGELISRFLITYSMPSLTHPP